MSTNFWDATIAKEPVGVGGKGTVIVKSVGRLAP